MVEMPAHQEVEPRLVPVLLQKGVLPEFVAVPHGKNEAAWQLFEKVPQFQFIGLRPRPVTGGNNLRDSPDLIDDFCHAGAAQPPESGPGRTGEQ